MLSKTARCVCRHQTQLNNLTGIHRAARLGSRSRVVAEGATRSDLHLYPLTRSASSEKGSSGSVNEENVANTSEGPSVSRVAEEKINYPVSEADGPTGRKVTGRKCVSETDSRQQTATSWMQEEQADVTNTSLKEEEAVQKRQDQTLLHGQGTTGQACLDRPQKSISQMFLLKQEEASGIREKINRLQSVDRPDGPSCGQIDKSRFTDSLNKRLLHRPREVSRKIRDQLSRILHAGARHDGKPQDGNSQFRMEKSSSSLSSSPTFTSTIYEEHWRNKEVLQALKDGRVIKGVLIQKHRNKAFIESQKGRVLIQGFKDRNRALYGDTVAVQLNERSQWLVPRFKAEMLKAKNTQLKVANSVPLDGVLENKDEISDLYPDSSVRLESVNVFEEEKIPPETGGNDIMTADDATHQPDSTITIPTEESESEQARNKTDMWFVPLKEVLAQGGTVAEQYFSTADGERNLRPTGKVVAIIEKEPNRRICAGYLEETAGNMTTFTPRDKLLPSVTIQQPATDKPEQPYSPDTLFIARITEWRSTNARPLGRLLQCIGETGEIDAETEAQLISLGIDSSDYPATVLSSLPMTKGPWKIPAKEFEFRRDLRYQCVFTIDPSTARDLDDALSVECLGNGLYEVGVHIADVTYFLKEGTLLDKMAARRATSVYLRHKVIPMLPNVLCENLCSLNPDEDKLTFSVIWQMNEEGEVTDQWFGRSVIRSCTKLSYDHAQSFIEQPEKMWTKDELPALSKGFTVEDIKSRTLILNKIAKNLRKQRMINGALDLRGEVLQFSLDDETGQPNGYSMYKQKDSNRLIEEFMLLANKAVARQLTELFPQKAILRNHREPESKKMRILKEECDLLGITMDTHSAGDVQLSMDCLNGDDEESNARKRVIDMMIKRSLQLAEYFCTGTMEDQKAYHHYGLNEPLYTHFTSPIRRYPDVLVHRLLGASLGYNRAPLMTSEEMQVIADHCNKKHYAADQASFQSSDLFLAAFLKVAGPQEEKAMVMRVTKYAIEVMFMDLGITSLISLKSMSLKQEDSGKMKEEKDKLVKRSVTVLWEGGPEGAAREQTISAFTWLDCLLLAEDKKLEWKAVLKRPS